MCTAGVLTGGSQITTVITPIPEISLNCVIAELLYETILINHQIHLVVNESLQKVVALATSHKSNIIIT